MNTPRTLDLVTIDKKELHKEFQDYWKDKMRRGSVSKMTAEEKKLVDVLLNWITDRYFIVLTKYDRETFNKICNEIMSKELTLENIERLIDIVKCQRCNEESLCENHAPRICGLCEKGGIPNGVWKHWVDSKPVHEKCFADFVNGIRASNCTHCTPDRKCPDHGPALTSNDD